MNSKKVFVTVGTTKFPKLIGTISTKKVIDTLLRLGYNLMQVQTGRDFSKVCVDTKFTDLGDIMTENNSLIIKVGNEMIIKYYEYFDNFEKEIESSDLVISHAGAGTCLEVLRKRKPLIIVVNEDLMDNHQIELAEELQSNGYLYYCTCDTLEETLKKDISRLKIYPEPDKFLFSQYLDKCVGFT